MRKIIIIILFICPFFLKAQDEYSESCDNCSTSTAVTADETSIEKVGNEFRLKDNSNVSDVSLTGNSFINSLSFDPYGRIISVGTGTATTGGSGSEFQDLLTPTLSGTYILTLGIENGAGTNVDLSSLRNGMITTVERADIAQNNNKISANNSIITFKQNGASIGEINLNQANNEDVNIPIVGDGDGFKSSGGIAAGTISMDNIYSISNAFTLGLSDEDTDGNFWSFFEVSNGINSSSLGIKNGSSTAYTFHKSGRPANPTDVTDKAYVDSMIVGTDNNYLDVSAGATLNIAVSGKVNFLLAGDVTLEGGGGLGGGKELEFKCKSASGCTLTRTVSFGTMSLGSAGNITTYTMNDGQTIRMRLDFTNWEILTTIGKEYKLNVETKTNDFWKGKPIYMMIQDAPDAAANGGTIPDSSIPNVDQVVSVELIFQGGPFGNWYIGSSSYPIYDSLTTDQVITDWIDGGTTGGPRTLNFSNWPMTNVEYICRYTKL